MCVIIWLKQYFHSILQIILTKMITIFLIDIILDYTLFSLSLMYYMYKALRIRTQCKARGLTAAHFLNK